MRIAPGIRLAILAAAVLTTASCDLLGTTEVISDRTIPLAELANRRADWDETGIVNYDFQYQRECSCPDFAQQPVTIEVRNDLVARVLDANGAELAPMTGVTWPTFDTLFVWGHEVLSDYDYGVDITFDETNSFPTRLRSFLLATQSGLDDHQVSNFVVVTP